MKVGDKVVYTGPIDHLFMKEAVVLALRTDAGDAVRILAGSGEHTVRQRYLEPLPDSPVPIPHGGKDDSAKLDMTLLFDGVPSALQGVARVLEGGAKKYAAHSWQQVPNGVQRYKAAFLRHLMDVSIHGWDHINTEDFGRPTIDHMLTDLLFIRELLTADGSIK